MKVLIALAALLVTTSLCTGMSYHSIYTDGVVDNEDSNEVPDLFSIPKIHCSRHDCSAHHLTQCEGQASLHLRICAFMKECMCACCTMNMIGDQQDIMDAKQVLLNLQD